MIKQDEKIKKSYFLPYQLSWLEDKSRLKIYEKSRRIGATYIQSYEDVRDAIINNGLNIFFTSADESAAREYIRYCEQWVLFYKAIFELYEETIIDDGKSIKAFTIELAKDNKTGRQSRIMALTSNPKRFRSKGGKVIIDEFAHHDNDRELWKAAMPCITWGFPIRVLSTHSGKNSMFYQIVNDAKNKLNDFSLHKTDIYQAVNDGLVDKIYQRKTTEEERKEWLENERKISLDADTWNEEYCCIPVDSATAFLTYDLISQCENNDCLWPDDYQIAQGHNMYLGMDIGRKKHLSVITIIEKIGGNIYYRKKTTMHNTPFKEQRNMLFELLPYMTKACIDSTGIGCQLAEEAKEYFGQIVEEVNFTPKVKEELAYPLRSKFESQEIKIPHSMELREDLHSVRKIVTQANNIRLDTREISFKDNDGQNVISHGDYFWSLALANHAAIEPAAIIEYQCIGRRRISASNSMANFIGN